MARVWFWIFAVLALCGCSHKVYVPVESVRTDTVYRGAARVDSVVSSDTVRILQRGDTVLTEVVRWRTRVRERHDTVKEVRLEVKEVPYEVEVVRTVERQRAWWENALMWAGGIGLVGLSCYAIIKCKLKR